MPSAKVKLVNKKIKEKIIMLLKEHPRYLPDLYRCLKLRKKKEHKQIHKIMEKLYHNKIVVKDNKGLLRVASSKEYITGKISVTSQGYGFVSLADEEAGDIFIPAKHTNSAFDGDTVRIRLLDDSVSGQRSGKGPVGIVYEVEERNRPYLVGELILKNDGYFVRPLSRRLPDDIKVVGSCKDAKRGDWVKADLVYGNKNRKKAACEIIGSLGKVGDIDNDIQAVILEYNLLPVYTEEEEKKATELSPADIERKDLTSLYCVTIDPHDAKDFDDAVSIGPGEKKGELTVGIHIADVAAWIQPGTYFDQEAAERGFTAYIPGNTRPMLPKQLTKNISLTYNTTSLAHTVLLTVNANTGEIKKQRRCHSKIKIASRLNFNEVENYIKKGEAPEGSDNELLKNLDSLIKTYRVMRKYRKENENFINISTTEIRVLRDDDSGEILGLEKKRQGDADQLVEEYMLAANSAVAKELTNCKIPGIYRIHPEPEEEKLDEFSDFVSNVFGISTGDLKSGREACQHFLNKISGKSYEEIIVSAFLRSLNRALYKEKADIHYGLGKGLYSHFTSPIRRYSDLAVHQQLWKTDLSKKGQDLDVMAEIATDCTEKEKITDEAYFAANDRLKLHYLQKLLNEKKLETYEGVIRKINSAVILADVPDIGITAVIQVKSVKGNFRKAKGKLVASAGSTNYKPGDIVYLQLEKIDFIKGDAIFRTIQF